MFLNLEPYYVLFPIAIILILSKLLSIVARKIGIPEVVGLLLTGVILGVLTLIPLNPDWKLISNDSAISGISIIAEIGVVLIMFNAGLETDIKQIKQTGVSAIIITIFGVILPLGLGYLASFILPNCETVAETILRNLFYGVILTATSVSVTVATLKELGKLNGRIGTSIVSAAILDDILGVIILSVILSLNKSVTSSDANIGYEISMVFLKTGLFFIAAISCGLLLRLLFKKLGNKYDHHRRIPVFALAVAFLYSFVAEKVFGIADITGAFFAGLIFSKMKDTVYIEKKMDIPAWLLFTPVFFAKVGITTISSFKDNNGITSSFIIFGVVFIFAGILGKFLGCGIAAKITKNTTKDSIRCGIGMMCRAEVCLISAQKGIDAGIISASIQPFILVLILITSFLTPLLLKLSYKNEIKYENELLFAQGETQEYYPESSSDQ